MKKLIVFGLLLPCLLLLSNSALAHPVVNYALQDASAGEIIWFYLKMGITHIVPLGIDHILFIVSLCLISKKLKPILWQATAFTVAHSVTLALSLKEIIVAPAPIIEPIIALSIVFVSIENLLLNTVKFWRILIVFFFGLVHGLGFASALNEVGIPPGDFTKTIIAFNIGVEIAQVGLIFAVFGLIIIPFSKLKHYKIRFVYPASIIIAVVAMYWTVERIIG